MGVRVNEVNSCSGSIIIISFCFRRFTELHWGDNLSLGV